MRKTLAEVHKIQGTKFRAIYVEENNKRHKRLTEYLQGNCPNGIECYALWGDYAEKQDEILQLCGDKSFAFFFIDPKGWVDVGIPKLTKLLRRPRSEFLITFMYDFLNRFKGMAEFRAQVSQMLGDLSEQDHQEMNSLSAQERADWVVRKYRKQLKAAIGPDTKSPLRTFHADVLHKDKNRVLYHLVYLTRHHKGIVKFAEASEKVDILQKVMRVQKKLNASNQTHLFSAEEQVAHHELATTNLDDVKAYWLARLNEHPVRYDEMCLADMLEETGWLERDFQDAFRELLAEKRVENLDGSARRTKHPIHFEKSGEQLRKLT